MKIFSSIEEIDNELLDGSIAIGNFDGLHLGHQAVVERLCQEYPLKKRGILTFHPHPREILSNEVLFKIINEEKKRKLFKTWPLDVLIEHKIDKSFLSLSPESFVRMLKEKLKISNIVVGDDFHFGKDKSGDINYLKTLANLNNIELETVNGLTIDGIRCSSTYIRNKLENGEVEIANRFLSRYFSIEGIVVKWQQEPKIANLICPSLGIKPGVYKSMTKVFIDEHEKYFNSITSINKNSVETHLINFDRNIYSQKIEVFFLNRHF